MADIQHILAKIQFLKWEIKRLKEEENKAERMYTQAYKDMFLGFGKKKVDKYVALANQFQRERKTKENELFELREQLPADARDQTYDD